MHFNIKEDYEVGSESSDKENKDNNGNVSDVLPDKIINVGDYVKVISGMFKGLYNIVLKNIDEVILNYLEKKNKWWVLKDGDLDCRIISDLIVVNDTTRIDARSHNFYVQYFMIKNVFLLCFIPI